MRGTSWDCSERVRSLESPAVLRGLRDWKVRKLERETFQLANIQPFMVIGILNFGEGSLAVNYLIFATVASLGVLQFVAGRGRLVGLMPLPAKPSMWLGLALIIGAYGWFFTIQPDFLIPGLAGGELFTLFLIGFLLALLIAGALGMVAQRVLGRVGFKPPYRQETVTLTDGAKAELWLPKPPSPPLVVALREASTDSLDILSGELVAAGGAVLLCDERSAEAAVEFAETNAARFHPARRYAMGAGRGADRVLQMAGGKVFNAVLALAPFGRGEKARPGLRWLRETDYLAALAAAARQSQIRKSEAPSSARIIYGDEDTLIPGMTGRQLYPSALMVAGARHMTLARMAATRRLAEDLFGLRPAETSASVTAAASSSPIRREVRE